MQEGVKQVSWNAYCKIWYLLLYITAPSRQSDVKTIEVWSMYIYIIHNEIVSGVDKHHVGIGNKRWARVFVFSEDTSNIIPMISGTSVVFKISLQNVLLVAMM